MPQTLAQAIKAKYPDYKDVPDTDLEDKWIAKYPDYKDAPRTAKTEPVPNVLPVETPKPQTSPTKKSGMMDRALDFISEPLAKEVNHPDTRYQFGPFEIPDAKTAYNNYIRPLTSPLGIASIAGEGAAALYGKYKGSTQPKVENENPKASTSPNTPTSTQAGIQEVAPVKPRVGIGVDGTPKLLNPNAETLKAVGKAGYIPKIEADKSISLKKVQPVTSPIQKVEPVKSIQAPPNEPPIPPETLNTPEPIEPSPKKSFISDRMTDVLNAPRSIKTAFDLSAPLRQGIGLIGKPTWWKSFKPMVQAAINPENYENIKAEIEDHPNYDLARAGKLALTDLGNQQEEAFASHLAEKIPGVKASARGYTTFLNKIRFDTFNEMVDKYKKLGIDLTSTDVKGKLINEQELKGITRYINNITGRGELDFKGPKGSTLDVKAAGKVLNAGLFSPRLIASRLNTFNPFEYTNMSPTVRREALSNLSKMGGIVGGAIGLAKVMGGDVNMDPHSSDFLKVKVGKTRLDLMGGFQQYAVLGARIFPNWLGGGKSISVSGKVSDLNSNKYGAKDRLDAIGQFLKQKESPIASSVHHSLTGKDNSGRPTTFKGEAENLFAPMMLDDLYHLIKEDPKSTPLIAPGIFGAGVQTMDTSPFPKFGKR